MDEAETAASDRPPESAAPGEPPVFAERPTERVVPDAYLLGALPLVVGLVAWAMGWGVLALLGLGLAGFVGAFFRNPQRAIPGDERTVVSPADGRVLEVGEIEDEEGRKQLRVGIFLSVFNVHVNRVPVAGRVVSVERSGSRYLAAFNRRAEEENVRCALVLRTAAGEWVRVVQITGLIARRIVCHPQPGEWLERGIRYGLIRFGSRTDVVMPLEAQPRVEPGQRVRGGSTILAVLPGGSS